MAERLHSPGSDETLHIDVQEARALERWSRRFGVTHDELKAAVKAVGNRPADVELLLTAIRHFRIQTTPSSSQASLR